MDVAVIGGAGHMGRWLVQYFLSRGDNVIISDVKLDEARTVAEETGVELAKNNFEAVKSVELIVVSTPIQSIPKILHEVAPHARTGTIIIEISSIKARLMKNLADTARLNLRPLSIHPLFGPGTRKLEGRKIALIPIFNSETEEKTVKKLFPEADIVVIDAEEHDRAMALTLSLPHFINIALASVISLENIELLKKLEGPTFKLQMILTESIMTEDPTLQASIQLDNKYTPQYLNKFLSKAKIIEKWIENKEGEKITALCNDMLTSLSKDVDLSRSYHQMYRILEKL
jgi:prephenate dehydrogenase